MLERCMEQGKRQPMGLFTLTIPTGDGKTVASLAFALRHARTHGLRRIIYVIPYTSIIEQNAQVFRDILGDKNVLEHHSGVLYDIADETRPENAKLARATENWDMPVVVTTAVQFFESLFANRSFQCRKLHNLAQSVIIFDETQMLPVPYLCPCVFAIAQLVKRYGVRELLELKGSETLDQKRILAMMEQDYAPSMPFRKIADRFHLIDSETKTIYIPQGEGEQLIQRLRSGERSRALIHIEDQRAENYRTVDGHLMHERVHDQELRESREDLETYPPLLWK